MNRLAVLLSFLWLLSASTHVQAGWLTQDVPSQVIADAKVAHLRSKIDLPLAEAVNRFGLMHVRCSLGQTLNEGADSRGGLLVAWLTKQTISHIVELTKIENGTQVTVYMNVSPESQRVSWPLLIDEWFIRGGNRCADELTREANEPLVGPSGSD